MLDNNIGAVLCWLAINNLCAVSVPINTALKGEFLRHQIADAAAPLARKPSPSDLSCLIYTSATTGPSKGFMVSYNFMCNPARLHLQAGPASATDVTITPLPLFHMNALAVGILSNILVGARVAILPRFSVSNF